MRILHSADWHIGRKIHGRDLTTHHEAFFAHLSEVIHSEDIDVLLVAGDIFDSTQISEQHIDLLSNTLHSLLSRPTKSQKKLRIILIPGNHDSASRLGYLSPLLDKRLTIATKAKDVGKAIEIPQANGDLGALIYPIPYLYPHKEVTTLATWGKNSQYFDESAICRFSQNWQSPPTLLPSHEAVWSAALRRVGRDLNNRNLASKVARIGVGHAFIANSTTSDNERSIAVGGIEFVPAKTIDTLGGLYSEDKKPLDYFAWGHLHRFQKTKTKTLGYYSGSPLAFSISEQNCAKRSIIIDTSTPTPTIEEISIPSTYRYTKIETTLDQIRAGKYKDFSEHWLEVFLTDQTPPLNMVEEISRYFPNYLSITYIGNRKIKTTSHSILTKSLSDEEIIKQFLEENEVLAPNSELPDVVKKLLCKIQNF